MLGRISAIPVIQSPSPSPNYGEFDAVYAQTPVSTAFMFLLCRKKMAPSCKLHLCLCIVIMCNRFPFQVLKILACNPSCIFRRPCDVKKNRRS